MMENEPQVGNREILSVLKEHHAWHQEPKKCIDEGSGVVWCLADAYSDSKLCDDTMAAIKTAREALTITRDSSVFDKDEKTNIVSECVKEPNIDNWKPIESAPRDGTHIFAVDVEYKNSGKVFFNGQEWELSGMHEDMSGLGIGFYPTHWIHIKENSK